jgi:SAM-dependent methyltransferase
VSLEPIQPDSALGGVKGNIVFLTPELRKYFSQNRIRWDQFYESERKTIEKVWPGGVPNVLDIGCGCGGLGLALEERFGSVIYTGVEINTDAAIAAARLNPKASVLPGDFLRMGQSELGDSFDMVISLSCIDWNLTFAEMLCKAWSKVRPGGTFIASFRLTTETGRDDINESYQYINYDGHLEGEIAPYVVLNAPDLMRRLVSLGSVGRVFGFGYFGPPSKTAITPFSQLCFAVLALKKSSTNECGEVELMLPEEIAAPMLEVCARNCP